MLVPLDSNAPLARSGSKDNLLRLAEAAHHQLADVPTSRSALITPPKKRRARKPARVEQARPRHLLAAAFKLCPMPNAAELSRLSLRTKISTGELHDWFVRRRLLERWVRREPTLTPSDVACLLSRCQALAQENACTASPPTTTLPTAAAKDATLGVIPLAPAVLSSYP